MIPDHITGKAITAASLALSDWLDERELTDRFPAHLIGCTPSMVSQVAISAALTSVYADIQAEALREAHATIQAELESDSLMARLLRLGCNQTGSDAVGWTQSVLESRADELDGGKP